MTIWGNHSATQYPDVFHAEIAGKNAAEVVGDQAWIENDFIPTVAKRGAAIIEARGSSSAASAASATIDAAHDWLGGSAEGDWVSMAVVSDGSYDVPEGLISSFPVTTSNGDWEIVQGLEIDDFSRGRIDASTKELAEERDAVKGLGLICEPGHERRYADRPRRGHRGRRRLRAAARRAAPGSRAPGGHLRRRQRPARRTSSATPSPCSTPVVAATCRSPPGPPGRCSRSPRTRGTCTARTGWVTSTGRARRASRIPGTRWSCCATCCWRPPRTGDPVTLVPLAPMTNIALLLRTYPAVAPGIGRIVFMGGAAHVGNATASAEFNVFHDPEAAAITLDACADLGIEVVMYGLDVFYAPESAWSRRGCSQPGRGPRRARRQTDRLPVRALRRGLRHHRRRRGGLRGASTPTGSSPSGCRSASSSPAPGRAAARSSTGVTGTATWPTTRTARRRRTSTSRSTWTAGATRSSGSTPSPGP